MRITCGNANLSSGQRQISTKLEALVQRCIEACRDVREVLAKVPGSRMRRRGTGTRAGLQLPDSAGDGPNPVPEPDPDPDESESMNGGADARQRELGSISERSAALAAICDRLLRELDGTEVRAAEIRFVVHKNEHATYPGVDPESATDLSAAELVWELRRLIAWADGALADVAGALETRAGDLDGRGRELLRDEVRALDIDLAVLKTHLDVSVDWDVEFGYLLSGEVAPFDDVAADEDDD